ncbi:hypothetical protein Trydic_g21547 [Trypoxylus dichotomus]
MEYHVLCMNVLLLVQIPSHDAIATYQDDGQRAYRRHIGSSYGKYDGFPNVNYWETGLKDSVYRTFLRKGYADPSLKDQILNAPLVNLRNRQATSFGDIVVLSRGQLYFSAGGFLFVEDENLYDCDECDVKRQSYHNYGQIVALWTVRRLRHRDKSSFYRYETEYLISPTGSNDYRRQNGAFNYDIPGYVFILKNSQTESFKNYLQPTPAWYNEEASRNLNSKVERRYLPPDTTTTTFYYTTPKSFYKNNQERYHHYDPDIVPAKNNVEKEIELYTKLLQSLKSIQTGTSPTVPFTSDTPATGYSFLSRLTPTTPSSTTSAKMFTTNIRFPDATPFKPSPMYTKYSEPDPLYTTTTPRMTTTSSTQPTRLTTEVTTSKPTTMQMIYSKVSQATPFIEFKPTSTTKLPMEYTTIKSSVPNTTTKLTTTTEATTTSKAVYPIFNQDTSTTEGTYSSTVKTTPQSEVANVMTKQFNSTQASFPLSTTPTTLTTQQNFTNEISTTSKISEVLETSELSIKTQNTTTSMSYTSSTTPISTTTQFDIFNIFDKLKTGKEVKHMEYPKTSEDESSETVKSQTPSLESSTKTTPYAETNQASSVVFTILENDITAIQPTTANENKLLPTIVYPEEITSYTFNVFENINKSKNNESTPGESVKKPNGDTATIIEEETTLKITSAPNSISAEKASEGTTKAFDISNIVTTVTSIEKLYEEEAKIITRKNASSNNPLTIENVIPRTLANNKGLIDLESEYLEASTTPITPKIETNKTSVQTTKTLATQFSSTRKYEVPKLLFSTTPMPSTYTTSRIRKYKYTKFPRRKTSKDRKSDTSSATKTANINIFKTTPKLNKLSLYVTSTTKQPERDIKLETTTPSIDKEDVRETNTVNENHITMPDTTIYDDEPTESVFYARSSETTVSPFFETETTERFTLMKETSTETTPTTLPYAKEQSEATAKAEVQTSFTNEISSNGAPTTNQRPNIATTPISSEIFDEIFGVFTKETTLYTTTAAPVTKRINKNNVNNGELEKELFGIVDRISLEEEENHPTQIEETTTEIASAPEIIFDNFYEASTSPVLAAETVNDEETTPVTSATLLVTETATELVNIGGDNESMLLTTTAIPITQNTVQPETITTECVIKTSANGTMRNRIEIAKIIAIQIVNTTKPEKRQIYENDILKANVSQINVGDKNFLVYKAVVGEKDLSSKLKERQTDLFNRLALSVVNHAKSINYLNRRKQQIRRKKVFKVKNRHKKKESTKN